MVEEDTYKLLKRRQRPFSLAQQIALNTRYSIEELCDDPTVRAEAYNLAQIPGTDFRDYEDVVAAAKKKLAAASFTPQAGHLG